MIRVYLHPLFFSYLLRSQSLHVLLQLLHFQLSVFRFLLSGLLLDVHAIQLVTDFLQVFLLFQDVALHLFLFPGHGLQVFAASRTATRPASVFSRNFKECNCFSMMLFLLSTSRAQRPSVASHQAVKLTFSHRRPWRIWVPLCHFVTLTDGPACSCAFWAGNCPPPQQGI